MEIVVRDHHNEMEIVMGDNDDHHDGSCRWGPHFLLRQSHQCHHQPDNDHHDYLSFSPSLFPNAHSCQVLVSQGHLQVRVNHKVLHGDDDDGYDDDDVR